MKKLFNVRALLLIAITTSFVTGLFATPVFFNYNSGKESLIGPPIILGLSVILTLLNIVWIVRKIPKHIDAAN